MAGLVDKSTPAVVTLFDTIPCGEVGRQRGLAKTLLFDVTHRLAQRVPLTKLVELDRDVHLYLVALIVAALVQAGENLVVPEGTQIMLMIREAFENMFLKEASHNCDNYGLISR